MAENGAALYKPLGLLAELTHRCPLSCPYCSNPVELDRANQEMSAAYSWKRIFSEAADLGVLHLHLSGGEPCSRREILAESGGARGPARGSTPISSPQGLGLYVRLFATTGCCRPSDHIQLLIQGVDAGDGRLDWRLQGRLREKRKSRAG